MGILEQECWRLPCPPPEFFSSPGIKHSLPCCRWMPAIPEAPRGAWCPAPTALAVRNLLLPGQAQLFHPEGMAGLSARGGAPSSLCCLSWAPGQGCSKPVILQSTSLHATPLPPAPGGGPVPSIWQQGSGWGWGRLLQGHPLSQALLHLPFFSPAVKLPQLHTAQAPLHSPVAGLVIPSLGPSEMMVKTGGGTLKGNSSLGLFPPAAPTSTSSMLVSTRAEDRRWVCLSLRHSFLLMHLPF